MTKYQQGWTGAWHLPGGPVGSPARWAATSNEGGSGTEDGAQRLGKEGSSDKLFAGGSRVPSNATAYGGRSA